MAIWGGTVLVGLVLKELSEVKGGEVAMMGVNGGKVVDVLLLNVRFGVGNREDESV